MPRRSNQNASLIPFLVLAVVVGLVLLTLYAIRAYQDAHPPTGSPDFIVGPSRSLSAATGPQTTNNNLLFGGPPIATNPDAAYTLLQNIGYVSGYSNSRKDPIFCAYHLSRVDSFTAYKRPDRFEPDPRVPNPIMHDDYNRTHYDRGHMAPNFAIMKHFGRDAQIETFLTTNIVPQKHALNAGPWEKLEKREDEPYSVDFGDVWIIDGPAFSAAPETFPAGVAIPYATWKIIVRVDHGTPAAMAVEMPQTVGESDQPQDYSVTIAKIEADAHLTFFPNLPAAERTQLESAPPTFWEEGTKAQRH
jgi:endonuclease G